VLAKDLTPAFRRVANAAAKGTVLKPLLHSYLFEARWKEDMTLVLGKADGPRAPDGWFHPSTHPLWPERMLFYYITQPDLIVPEPLEYMGTMSVTIGTLMHLFIQECLRDQGVLLGPGQLRAEGIVCDEKGEPFLVDEECGSRGHTDGITSVHLPLFPAYERQNFEFKSGNIMKLSKIQDLDLEAFKTTWPHYWAQQQEYLRMSGYQVSVVLMLAMGYPWELREFHIPADERWQIQVRDKYLRVRAAAEIDQAPMPCCGVGSAESRSCPARTVCPVALMKQGKKL
jgi:hypothetical protein